MSERSRILGRGLQQDKGTLRFDPSPELLLWKEVSFPEKTDATSGQRLFWDYCGACGVPYDYLPD